MDIDDFLAQVRRRETIVGGSAAHQVMHATAQEALRLVAELNTGYHSPEEVRALLSALTGRAVPESVTVFPPFHTEFGRNLEFGPGVFINQGCRFQDTGGITLGADCLIGHGTTITTLNHALDPGRRADMEPAPVMIGRRVWIGAAATVLPGVTIGEGAVVGAGAVVTRDVPADTIVAGVPARVLRPTGYTSATT